MWESKSCEGAAAVGSIAALREQQLSGNCRCRGAAAVKVSSFKGVAAVVEQQMLGNSSSR